MKTKLAVLAAFMLCFGHLAHAQPGNSGSIVVRSAVELQAALAPGNAGRRIVVHPGTYLVTTPLEVPDGAILQGKGVMLGEDFPTGIDPLTESAIVAAPGFVGDLLTLGDGSRISRLVIRQVEGSAGNAVVLGSRAPKDSVSATIWKCEIINPNAPGAGPQGPTGRGVVVIARNPNIAADPPPHDGADLKLSMRHSVVRSPGGASAIFGINFASEASVKLILKNNALGGGLDIAAGVSRGDLVRDSSTDIRSFDNLYFAEEGFTPPFGVRLLGGSDAPIPMGWPGGEFNYAGFRSRNDVIDGFALGVYAVAGNRFMPENDVSIGNIVELRLNDLVLNSLDADFVFWGAYSEGDDLEAGASNFLSVFGRGIQGSGAGPNRYQWIGPVISASADWSGQYGNRLAFLGSARDFLMSNSNLNPFPHPSYFVRF